MAIPKVSVVMITYSHENYIREAIEGVLMQQIDFSVELIIANDCSPDNTDIIVNDIIATNKSTIEIVYKKHDKNIGMMANFIFALNLAKSKYVALCDGDDYWTDPLKLQKQVDFLEENQDYIIHGAQAQVIENKNVTNKIIGYKNEPKILKLSDFFDKNNLVTCTVMFRKNNNIISEFPKDIFFGDWFCYILLLQNNDFKAYSLNQIFAMYRKHSNGVYSSLEEFNKVNQNIKQIIAIKKYLGYLNFNNRTIKSLNNYFFKIFCIEKKKNIFLALKVFFRNIKYCGKSTSFKKYLKEFYK